MHRLSKFEKNYRSAPVVVSIRNPLDSISSSIQRYGKDPTDEVIKEQIQEYEKEGLWDILGLFTLAHDRECVIPTNR